ncbi:hypothetical protein SRHO_G00177050 [Serrasalmus rhombeus]
MTVLRDVAKLRVFLALLLPLLVGSNSASQELFPTDCSDVYANRQTPSGVYTIYPAGSTPVQVQCDMGCDGQTKDGNWTRVVFCTLDTKLVVFALVLGLLFSLFTTASGDHVWSHSSIVYSPDQLIALCHMAVLPDKRPDIPAS